MNADYEMNEAIYERSLLFHYFLSMQTLQQLGVFGLYVGHMRTKLRS
jgi:hypothetical protein